MVTILWARHGRVFTRARPRWASGLFGEGREPGEGGLELAGRGRPGPRQALLIAQPGPVVGMGDPRARGGDRLELPSPEVPGRLSPHLGGPPGDQAVFVELDHVVFPDAAVGERHREQITRPADPLPVRCPGQVVVAVPARLLSRIRDQLEDPPRLGRDLSAGADHARRLLLDCHVPIQTRGHGPRDAGGYLDTSMNARSEPEEVVP